MLSFPKKILIIFSCLIFFFVSSIGSLVLVEPAKAINTVSIPVQIIEDTPGEIKAILSKIAKQLEIALISSVVKSVDYMARKVAYQSAVYLASGDKGQSPFAQTTSFGQYMKDVSNEAGGKLIEELGKPFGLNLCHIPNPQLDLALRIGLHQKYGTSDADQTAAPDCTASQFWSNWSSSDNWSSQWGSAGAALDHINASISPDQSDLGIFLDTQLKVDDLVAKYNKGKEAERVEGQGYKAATNYISGNIKTPASIINKEFEAKTPSEKEKMSQSQIWSVAGTGAFQVLPSVLSTFVNTLGSQMLKNYVDKGVLPFSGFFKDSDSTATSYEGVSVGGRQAAEALFADILKPTITEKENYRILDDFSSCDQNNRGVNNCIMDEQLASAVDSARNEPLTIQQALDNNILNKNGKLISPKNKSLDNSVDCYNSGNYCYSNIKKMRLAGILPVGFEIAALNSDPDNGWNLGEVVAGFNNCNYKYDANDKTKIVSITYDPAYPYCHLIDPNWVLKIDQTRCKSEVFNNQLLSSDVGQRAKQCVDSDTCVGYNADGTCFAYGYCTQSKNTWNFEADTCDRQYNTCLAMTDSSNKQVGYLRRTLDNDYCNADTVGCTAYSLTKENGEWLEPRIVQNNYNGVSGNSSIFFNSKILPNSSSCSPNSDGCSAFKIKDDINAAPLKLRKAPNYLKCYDVNPTTPKIDWPTTAADFAKIQGDANCKNYASACVPQEVGCNWFDDLLTNESVPGKITPAEQVVNSSGETEVVAWNDQCSEKCVGYDSYVEMPTYYAGGNDLAYIIPDSGTTCTKEESGCASFTNIGANGQGEQIEYYSYLRPCETPDNANKKVFITYEGSAAGGYQLKTYTLAANTDGSPKYYYRTSEDLTGPNGFYNTCNEALWKANKASDDCRQFNDEKGNVYYALLAQTIVVSDQCSAYRLNNTELYEESRLSSESRCVAAKGKWDNGKCNVCYQNGEYKDGYCYYYGLPGGVENSAGNSSVCSAAVETCRQYLGKDAAAPKDIFSDGFEESDPAEALAGWGNAGTQMRLATESTNAYGHSLQKTAGSGNVYKNIIVTVGDSYDLTFWAKGDSNNIKIEFTNPDGVGVLADSQIFGNVSVGSVWKMYHLGPIKLDSSSTNVSLRFYGTGEFFLDNVKLVQKNHSIYLVKKTLSVDPVCDSHPEDNLPGEALGCRKYTTRINNVVTPLYLTGFSYLCREGAIGCTAVLDTYNTLDTDKGYYHNIFVKADPGTKVEFTYSDSSVSTCRVTTDSDGCYINMPGGVTIVKRFPDVGFNIVTSTVITPADTPPGTPIYLVANSDSNCSDSDLGCTLAGMMSYTTSGMQFATVTIKNDPALYDKALCQAEAQGCDSYVQGGSTYYYKDPTIMGQKVCEYKTNIVVNGAKMSGWFWQNNTPCYPDYVDGNEYGLWSFGNKDKYQGFVGSCPTSQSGCSEFVDHADNNKAYYFFDNSALRKNDRCEGKVSMESGCILLDQTENPTKNWNTANTYQSSKNNKYNLTEPVAGTTNDANLIVAVTRDRACGEWLACKSSATFLDGTNGPKEVCIELGLCDQAKESNSLVGQCAHWVDTTKNRGQILNQETYVSRDVSFAGKDYTGFSLYNKHRVVDLGVKPVAGDVGLGYKGVSGWESIDGNSTTTLITNTCRAYPEQDSPFPAVFANKNLTNINLCTEDGDACDCSYTKVVYGSSALEQKEKYFSVGKGVGTEGICRGGYDAKGEVKDGVACYSDMDCRDERLSQNINSISFELSNGVCVLPNQSATKRYVGWTGYCLEKDLYSDVCNLWYPVETPSGLDNRYNLFSTAGYIPPEGSGRYWCAAAKGNSNIHSDFFGTDGYKRNILWFNKELFTSEGCINEKTIDAASLGLDKVNNRIHVSEFLGLAIQNTGVKNNGVIPNNVVMNAYRDQTLSGVQIILNNPNQDARYWSGPLKLRNGEFVLDLVWQSYNNTNFEANQINKNIDYDKILTKTGKDLGNLLVGNQLGLRVIFDYKGYFKEIRTKKCFSSGNTAEHVDLYFYVNEVCKNIWQFVKEDTNKTFGVLAKPRTDRLWTDSNYLISKTFTGSEDNLAMPYNQLFSPYGSFNQSKNPSTQSFADYIQNFSSENDKQLAAKRGGYWPIWLSSGGATPLSCSGESGGDCGRINICVDGPNKGSACTPDNSGYSLDCGKQYLEKSGTCVKDNTVFMMCANLTSAGKECHWGENAECNRVITNINCGVGDKIDACYYYDDFYNYNIEIPNSKCDVYENNCPSSYVVKDGVCSETEKSTKIHKNCSNNNKVCDGDEDCQILPTDCNLKSCELCSTRGPGLHSCQTDQDCNGGKYGCTTHNLGLTGNCVMNPVACKDGEGYYNLYECKNEGVTRGTCIGGNNSGKVCGSNKDCPSVERKDSVTGNTYTEVGICVGSPLDDGKVIPQDGGSNAKKWRALEMFTQVFGAWEWGDEVSESSYFKIEDNLFDYAVGVNKNNVGQKIMSVVSPKPPRIWAVETGGKDAPTVKVGGKDSFSINNRWSGDVRVDSGVATLDFFAAADHNQMPITRVMIDWNDGSPIYSTSGWFKNHKPKCGLMTIPTSGSAVGEMEEVTLPTINACINLENSYTGCRVRFGDSSGACEENYFSFTHYYICTKDSKDSSGASVYDPVAKVCKFQPKVQVLDNWGWCSGVCESKYGCYKDGGDNNCVDTNGKKIGDDFNPWIWFGGNSSAKNVIVPVKQ